MINSSINIFIAKLMNSLINVTQHYPLPGDLNKQTLKFRKYSPLQMQLRTGATYPPDSGRCRNRVSHRSMGSIQTHQTSTDRRLWDDRIPRRRPPHKGSSKIICLLT